MAMRLIGLALAALFAVGCYSSVTSTEPAGSRGGASWQCSSSASATRNDRQLDVAATVLTTDGRFVPNVTVTSPSAQEYHARERSTDQNGAVKAGRDARRTITATAGSLTSSVTVVASQLPVTPTPPTRRRRAVSLSANSVTVGSAATLSAQVMAAPTSATFSFGDGSPDVTGTGFSVTHTCRCRHIPGLVTVKDSFGRTASASTSASVSATVTPPPTLAVSLSATSVTGSATTLSARSWRHRSLRDVQLRR